MSKYSVRIGKTQNTVYVLTPKGRVLRYIGCVFVKRTHARKASAFIRSALRAGEKLDPKFWTVLPKKEAAA